MTKTASGELVVVIDRPEYGEKLHINYIRKFDGPNGFVDTFVFTLNGEGTLHEKLLKACHDMIRQFE